ncbi:MAG: Hsp20/alpha crystallin family protein [Solirubrobacterales bacterium]|nr:Hsp20/alpha crystallin family protein [Solirubrobacterales bacterium]MCB8970940.1 Hsp20/alpha crystallin family protein [Thermoleophilales bacterium]MCO5326164.1 Hsp20/alpha crystallin family protein [Solirubrobacterales bacterium]
MSRQRTLVLNIERMRREMDELLGDTWASVKPGQGGGFSPRADVYYAREGERDAVAVVTVDLAGVSADVVSLEVSGRVLVVSGKRPVRDTQGRAYQQVEIPTGTFRRAIELGIEVDADRAKATFEDGLLRVELPVRLPDRTSHSVPIESPPK